MKKLEKEKFDKPLQICRWFWPWLIAFATATLIGVIFIFETWKAYSNLPMVTVPNPKPVPIEKVLFPSVTVCGLNRVKKSTYQKYENIANGGDSNGTSVNEAKYILTLLDSLCNPSNILVNNILWKDRTIFGLGMEAAILNYEMHNSEENKKRIIMGLLEESSPNCNELITTISRGYLYYPSAWFFEKVETEFGFCCAFNSVPAVYLKPTISEHLQNANKLSPNSRFVWKSNDSVPINVDTISDEDTRKKFNFRLWTQTRPGFNQALSFPLLANRDEYHCTSPELDGYWLSVQHSLDGGFAQRKKTLVKFNTENYITVHPDITFAEQSIRKFEPKERGCYFADEYSLNNYKSYTQSNCLLECIANKTKEYCPAVASCVIKWYSWIYNHVCEPTDVCDSNKYSTVTAYGPYTVCTQCLPSCNEIGYDYQIETNPISNEYIQRLMEAKKLGGRNDTYQNLTVVHVFLDKTSHSSKIKKVQFNLMEFITNSGGIFELCLGVTLLLMMERLYYFIMCNYLRHRLHSLRNCEDTPKGANCHGEIFTFDGNSTEF